MPRVRLLQTSLTSGQLDPAMIARTDVAHYYAGAQSVLNMELLPQGGARVRPGWRRGPSISGVVIDGVTGAAMAELRFNADQTYLVLVTHQLVRVFRNGVQVSTKAAPWTADQIADLTWARAADTMLFFHPEVRPQRLMRQGSHTSWTFGNLPVAVWPTRNFGTDTVGTATPTDKLGTISITASAAADFAGIAPGYIIRLSDGSARVTKIVSAVKVEARVLSELSEITAAEAGDWTVEEFLWSDVRGWPGAGTFHSDRLYLGGSTQAPDTIAGSVSGEYFTFDEGKGLDDEAVIFASAADEVNPIVALFSGRHLLTFTEGTEFATTDFPITPSSVSAITQTRHGSAKIRPVGIENGVMFVTARREAEHQAVMETVWNEYDSYAAQDISLLAASCIRGPVDMTLRTGNDLTRAYHLFVVNGDDGTLAVLNTMRTQDITGWSMWQTAGTVLRVAVAGNTLYLLTERTINGATVIALEYIDPAARLDCSKVVTAGSASVTHGGFSHLIGETVAVYADGHPHHDVIVAPDGTVTLDYPAVEVECGLAFDWEIIPMPIAIDLLDGTAIGTIKRVCSVSLVLRNAVDVSVDGRPLAFRRFGDDLLDQPPTPYTGTLKIRRLGYDRSGVLRLHGRGPATVLGIIREVTL